MKFLLKRILTNQKTKYTDNLHSNTKICGSSNTLSSPYINELSHASHQDKYSVDGDLTGLNLSCRSIRVEETPGELVLKRQNNHPELSLMQINTEKWDSQTGSMGDILLINLPPKYNNIRLKILLFTLLNNNNKSRLVVDPDSFYSIRSVGI